MSLRTVKVKKVRGGWKVVSHTGKVMKRLHKSRRAAQNAARAAKSRYRCRYKCKK